MKRDELYINELAIALIVITMLFTAYWYYSELNRNKNLATEQIKQFRENCKILNEQKSSCELTQTSYKLESTILCSDSLIKEQDRLFERIIKSYNLFEIKELMRLSPVNEFESLSNVITIGEINAGNEFFGKTIGLKLQALNNIGAIDQCELRTIKIKDYARCDLKYTKAYLKKNQKEVAKEYLKIAEESYNSEDYFAAIHYTTGAIAYQDRVSRAAYKELIEAGENGLVC